MNEQKKNNKQVNTELDKGHSQGVVPPKNMGQVIAELTASMTVPLTVKLSKIFDQMLRSELNIDEVEINRYRKKQRPESELLYTQNTLQRINKVSTDKKIESMVSDVTVMRQYYGDYSSKTGENILENLEAAWDYHINNGGQWGPGTISKFVFREPAVISRYLGAFTRADITDYKGIRIPHRTRLK